MDEPGFLLRAVTWHIGSGDAIFTGWGLLLLAAMLHARGVQQSRVSLVAVLAMVWLALADAISLRVMMVIGFLGIIAFLWNWLRPTHHRLTPRMQLAVWAIATLFFVGVELAWQIPLHPVATEVKSIAIIGDSVTAGLNAADVTWPRQLAESTGRTIYDASQQGATVKSALTQLESLDGHGDVLWIEIGGNDILESLPVDVYAERLDALLQSARTQYQTIVMMEIPAPPGGGGYGVTQRTLATKYHFPLVPKRQLLWVLTSSGSTQDGVHLANAGHQRMASLVQRTLGWTNSPQPGDYHRVE